MTWSHAMIVSLLAATIAVSGCGKKGDPVRPGEEPREESSTS